MPWNATVPQAVEWETMCYHEETHGDKRLKKPPRILQLGSCEVRMFGACLVEICWVWFPVMAWLVMGGCGWLELILAKFWWLRPTDPFYIGLDVVYIFCANSCESFPEPVLEPKGLCCVTLASRAFWWGNMWWTVTAGTVVGGDHFVAGDDAALTNLLSSGSVINGQHRAMENWPWMVPYLWGLVTFYEERVIQMTPQWTPNEYADVSGGKARCNWPNWPHQVFVQQLLFLEAKGTALCCQRGCGSYMVSIWSPYGLHGSVDYSCYQFFCGSLKRYLLVYNTQKNTTRLQLFIFGCAKSHLWNHQRVLPLGSSTPG